MATYVVLVSFTDQGVRNIKQTTERAKALAAAGTKLGVKVKDTFWTLGAYDAVLVADAPDDEAMTALCLSVGSLGNIRTQTMRAYSADEMSKILAKMP
ncbi:MAG: GYD family protein [Deltaproteobacteria bacterium RIFCSPLOWO2_12_FULL_60_19]|nr:MAG: GYD family protein [Deltaproteobacteria bacterium RIFCSPLOWO2_12_FULL_60_19]